MAKRKIAFTNRRRDWGQSRGAITKGAPLVPSAADASKYEKAMMKLVKPMMAEYEREVARLYKSEGYAMDASISTKAKGLFSFLAKKWQKRFEASAAKMVENMIGSVSKSSMNNLESSLKDISGGMTIKPPEYPRDLRVRVAATTQSNVELIKTIPERYASKIQGIVLRSIETGNEGSKTIYDEIMKLGESTPRQARLIAVTETKKLNAVMGEERAKAAGITHFEWVHSGGGNEPRELHVKLSGQIFSYDDLPVIDTRTGERGLPGQLINCKCIARPIFNFGANNGGQD